MKVIRFITRLVNEPFDWHFKPWLAVLIFVGYIALFVVSMLLLHATDMPNV